jgi:hypothetical protein
MVASVATNLKTDHCVTRMDFAIVHRVSYGTMHNILHDELGLVKRSARWVPELLIKDQK